MIRLVLADDHPIVLDGLVQLFSKLADFEVLACARNGTEALTATRQFRPDILVLDLRMPEMDGVTVIREMNREGLSTPVVVLTALDNGEVFQAVRLGVRGVVLKDTASSFLVQCVREVHAGRTWLDKTVARRAVGNFLKREAGANMIAATLTPREMEVARLIANGLPSKAIASALSICEGTAKLHLHHVYEKLHLDGRMALMRYMQGNGFD